MVHPAYEFRFSYMGELRQQLVAVGVKKYLGGRMILEIRLDLVDHLYIQVMDIWELDSQRKRKRKTKIVNIYHNWVEEGQPWCGIEMSEEEL